jgi:O-glycosyl hydrolase
MTMHVVRRHLIFAATCAGLLATWAGTASGQPETMAWGNLTGIRVDGHLFELNSSMCVVEPDGSVFTTGREKQTNNYSRNGKTETVTVQMRAHGWALNGKEIVEDTGTGTAKVDIQFDSPQQSNIAGAYWRLDLPAALFSGGNVQIIGAVKPTPEKVSLAPGLKDQNDYLRGAAKGLHFTSGRREIEIAFSEPAEVLIRDDRRNGNYDLQVTMAVLTGKASAGQTAGKSFTVKVAGDVDHNPVTIALDASHPGQLFDGLGGNFRLQNPTADPAIIDYNLKNLRVAWGRVEMPWSTWQPQESGDPLAAARAGTLNPRIQPAMEMARRLGQKGMPVIVSAWAAPAWAVLGMTGRGGGGDEGGLRGNPLNPQKMDQIKKSIADYLVCLKEKFGVEAAMFTFNESDLGINVRQTGLEHAEMIKTFGAYFASRGLATKLALGDTSDATPVEFIQPALHDPEAAKYIAAVDFHSWRGCTDEILAQWRAAARQLNVPLLVAEGSTDAAAWRYPQIFSEQSFALYEINLYMRILAVAQPQSILQWQLTSDYSILAGGGAFGDNGPIRPTRRFWNFKQLASTPERSFSLPVACSGPNLTCAGFGNIAEGVYTVHVVNNGAARQATLTGLPAGVKELRVWVTDSQRGMEEGARISVAGGKAELKLEATSYTTVIGVP